MSDDDLHASSPYDELEEILLDADPTPDLADDLAEHTAPSPVYQDDPGYELLGYYSDWDYYSDDYYDDDVALLQKNPQDGNPLKDTQSKLNNQASRGRKRKLAEVERNESFDFEERKALRDCIKGTVWAKPVDNEPNIYHEGQNSTVALLKDWKDLFKVDQIPRGRPSRKTRVDEDESWAKDMSLADMGLQNARGHNVNGGEENDGGMLSEEEADYTDEKESLISEQASMKEVATLQLSSFEDDDHENHLANGRTHVIALQKEEKVNTVKRMKKSALPSPPSSSEHLNNEAEDGSDKLIMDTDSSKGTTLQPDSQDQEGSQVTPTPSTTRPTTSLRNRKRKASISAEETDDSSRTLAGNRAKRVASSRVKSAGQSGEKSTPPVTRSTRSRKG